MIDQSLRVVLIVFGVLIAAWVLKFIDRARDGIRHTVRGLAKAYLTFVVAFFGLGVLGRSEMEAFLGGTLGAALVVISTPKRRRYVPAKVRRQVIAQFEAESGEKYNSRKHHIDHIVPFSKGGSHTVVNLQVIPKRKNLKKGARLPGLLDE